VPFPRQHRQKCIDHSRVRAGLGAEETPRPSPDLRRERTSPAVRENRRGEAAIARLHEMEFTMVRKEHVALKSSQLRHIPDYAFVDEHMKFHRTAGLAYGNGHMGELHELCEETKAADCCIRPAAMRVRFSAAMTKR